MKSIIEMILDKTRMEESSSQLREANLNYLNALMAYLNKKLAPEDKHLGFPADLMEYAEVEHGALEYFRKLK